MRAATGPVAAAAIATSPLHLHGVAGNGVAAVGAVARWPPRSFVLALLLVRCGGAAGEVERGNCLLQGPLDAAPARRVALVHEARTAAPGDPERDYVRDDDQEEAGAHLYTEEVRMESTAMALMLWLNVAVVTGIAYLVNSKHPEVWQATFVILSSTISIFCAVLLFNAIKYFTEIAFGKKEAKYGPPDTMSLAVSFMRLLVLAAMWQVLLFFVKHSRRAFAMVAVMGSEVIGFSAIDAFGQVQQMDYFSASPLRSALAIPIACVGLWVLCTLSDHARERSLPEERLRSTETELYCELCQEAEDEYIGLTLGLLVSLVIRFAIIGKLPPLKGDPMVKQPWDVVALAGACLATGILIILFCSLRWSLASDLRGLVPKVDRLCSIVTSVLSMTLGWCLLSAAEWGYWCSTSDEGLGLGGKMTARVVVALTMSALTLVGIYTKLWITDKLPINMNTLRGTSMVQFFGLLLGLSWKAVFKEALSSLSMQWAAGPMRTLVDGGLSIALCLFVMPPWALYIIPPVLDIHEEAEAAQHAHGQGLGAALPTTVTATAAAML